MFRSLAQYKYIYYFCRYIWGSCPPPQYQKAGYASEYNIHEWGNLILIYLWFDHIFKNNLDNETSEGLLEMVCIRPHSSEVKTGRRPFYNLCLVVSGCRKDFWSRQKFVTGCYTFWSAGGFSSCIKNRLTTKLVDRRFFRSLIGRQFLIVDRSRTGCRSVWDGQRHSISKGFLGTLSTVWAFAYAWQ